jgi:biopolymer transport protein ExbD
MKTRLKPTRGTVDDDGDANPVPDIASLVDVSFLLLIYFLVAMTVTPRESDLAAPLPGIGSSAPLPDPPLQVAVTAAGEVIWGGRDTGVVADAADAPSSLPGLGAALRMAKAAAVSPSFLIDVDNAARQQRVIDVLNCFAGEGVGRVAMLDRGGD